MKCIIAAVYFIKIYKCYSDKIISIVQTLLFLYDYIFHLYGNKYNNLIFAKQNYFFFCNSCDISCICKRNYFDKKKSIMNDKNIVNSSHYQLKCNFRNEVKLMVLTYFYGILN